MVYVRVWLAWLVLPSCNWVFGLEPTSLPPPDAPPTCPAFGQSLEFSASLADAVNEPCFQYTASQEADLATAACGTGGTYTIREGTLGSKVLADSMIAPILAGDRFDQVALTPEGDQLFVRELQGAVGRFVRYRRLGNAWQQPDMPFAQLSSTDSIGTPSDRTTPSGRRLAVAHNISLIELAENPDGTYRQLRETLYTDLQVTFIFAPNLSRDGLRVTFHGTNNSVQQVLIAERSSLDTTFGPARPIGGLPTGQVMTPFMTEDCGRLYFSSLGRVMYASR